MRKALPKRTELTPIIAAGIHPSPVRLFNTFYGNTIDIPGVLTSREEQIVLMALSVQKLTEAYISVKITGMPDDRRTGRAGMVNDYGECEKKVND